MVIHFCYKIVMLSFSYSHRELTMGVPIRQCSVWFLQVWGRSVRRYPSMGAHIRRGISCRPSCATLWCDPARRPGRTALLAVSPERGIFRPPPRSHLGETHAKVACKCVGSATRCGHQLRVKPKVHEDGLRYNA